MENIKCLVSSAFQTKVKIKNIKKLVSEFHTSYWLKRFPMCHQPLKKKNTRYFNKNILHGFFHVKFVLSVI